MTRRLKSRLFYTAALLSGAFFVLCSLFGFMLHGEQVIASSDVRCDTVCHSHNQGPTSSVNSQQQEEDDKEPFPPTSFWAAEAPRLVLYYLAPYTPLLALAYLRKKRLLTTQLRF